VCIFTLTFFYQTNTGFSDILKDLQKFTESLGDVVTQISELGNRISTLESENKSKDKQIAEYNQSMANIEAHLKDLDANVERVANMASLKGVKDIVKEFEGTLKVFKKRFAKLDNRVEDQEVKTSVLEKMYKAANQPLDTLMQTLDAQKSLIESLEGKLNKQETLITSMRDNLENQTSLVASLGIEDLNTRISNLESTTHYDREKHAPDKLATTHDDHEKHAPDKLATTHDDHEKHAPDKLATTHDDQEKHVPDKLATTPGLIDIGEGFFIKNVKFKPFGSSSQISGEIMNKSERNYGMIDFKLQTYDMENVPLGGLGFSIYGFKKGKVGTFEEIIAGIENKKIAKYSIYPAQMPLVSESGEKTIKIIEKELPTAKTETTNVAAKELAPENLEDLLFDEATPGKLEGLENIGNGFYASDISFSGFGSSSTVTGKIKNNSKEDFYSASFVMKIFSKEYGMLTSFDFSIRSIKGGDTVTFEEIIAGVRHVDINTYEIAFKSSY
jgi:peptidoglycan hydrolase CwlO-like protein